MIMNIKLINGGKLPEHKTFGSVGADCYARLDSDVIVFPGTRIKIPLGFAVEIPEGFEIQIRPRSGLASNDGIFVITGTIDSDYRGEVCAIVYNAGDNNFVIKNQDRIAQLIVAPVIKAKWKLSDELTETVRGKGGFGSTGLNSKYYEPFTKVLEVEKTLGKRVLIDSSVDAIVEKVFVDNNWTYVHFRLLDGQKINDKDSIDLLLTSAFQRVKIDNHLFGKEINFEDN